MHAKKRNGLQGCKQNPNYAHTAQSNTNSNLFEVVKEVMLKKEKEEIEKILETDEGRQRIFRALMGDGGDVVEGKAVLRRAALAFCRQAMKRRNMIVQTLLNLRT